MRFKSLLTGRLSGLPCHHTEEKYIPFICFQNTYAYQNSDRYYSSRRRTHQHTCVTSPRTIVRVIVVVRIRSSDFVSPRLVAFRLRPIGHRSGPSTPRVADIARVYFYYDNVPRSWARIIITIIIRVPPVIFSDIPPWGDGIVLLHAL